MSTRLPSPPAPDSEPVGASSLVGAVPSAAQLVGGHGSTRVQRYRAREPMQASIGYSRFVQMMKVALPLTAALLVALIVAWPYIEGEDAGFRIGFSSLQLSSTEQSGMDNARYVGVDDQRRPYNISADIARLVDGSDNTVTLEMPKADLTMKNGAWLVMTADTGRYESDQQNLKLVGNVNLFHDSGYELNTSSILFDLAKNSAVGDAPVTGHGPFGQLDSQGIRIDDKGSIIYFTGKSKLLLYPSKGDGTVFGSAQ